MCVSPISIKIDSVFSDGLRSVLVPCGKCVECKIRYQNDWMVRLVEECRNWSNVCFITLTYSNKNVPFLVDSNTGQCHLTVYKKHVQDWFKRMRENYFIKYGSRMQLKYFCTSEYGPRTLRPHYHIIIFGHSKNDIIDSLNDWQSRFGFYCAKDINLFSSKSIENSMRYVAKYCSKGEFENWKVSKHLVFPTFHLISKRIGFSYIERMKNFHLQKPVKILRNGVYYYSPDYIESVVSRRCVTLANGFQYHMPRYYSTNIYGEKTLLSFQIASFLLEKFDDLYFRELVTIQAQRSCNFNEAVNLYNLQKFQTDKILYEEKRTRLSNFYNKSLI